MTDAAEVNTESALLELAERCEAATGPSLDIDAAIVHAVIAPNPDAYDWDNHKWLPYTASLDAAMTLVPEGWHLTLDDWTWAEEAAWRARLETVAGQRFAREARSVTAALALCAAALRASLPPSTETRGEK